MPLARLLPGVIVLAITWLGPLPDLARHSFAAHMTMHVTVVAIAAPILSIAVAGTAIDPTRARPRLLAPIPASIGELIVVWAWHAPTLHQAARQHLWVLVLEQATFLSAGLWLWIAVSGGERNERRGRAGTGVVALLFTSMHMTLLGALFALARRPLFAHAPDALAVSPLPDQQLGGVIMLFVGGASYLAGGLWLTAAVLRREPRREVSP